MFSIKKKGVVAGTFVLSDGSISEDIRFVNTVSEEDDDSGDDEEEEEPVPAAVAVMERAKEAITPFSLDIDTAQIQDQIVELNRELSMLHGIEQQAKEAISAKVTELTKELSLGRAYQRFAGEKKRLSPEVLGWRKSKSEYLNGIRIPTPAVALFSLDADFVRIENTRFGNADFTPGIPWSFREYYKDVLDCLALISANFGQFSSMSVRMMARFSGVIPMETKEKIREARDSKSFSEIRLLAEADWAIDAYPDPRYADPIVVGMVNDEMWVIDVFDPTPLEDYIAKEFTS